MICEKCYEEVPSLEKHHLFPNTRINRELYGKLLEDPENIKFLCYGCHHGHKGKVEHYSEKKFCGILGIETRSKSGKL
jgi:5-methylcytosine-specific restriction endonuclease McrA